MGCNETRLFIISIFILKTRYTVNGQELPSREQQSKDPDQARNFSYRIMAKLSQTIFSTINTEVFRSDGARESHDVRYFLTSLDPNKVTPHDLQDLVRDRWWEEGRHYLSRPGLGKVWTLMTYLAISVLRLVQEPGEPLANFHYSPKIALQLLGFNQN